MTRIALIFLLTSFSCLLACSQSVVEKRDTVFVSSEQIKVSAEVGTISVPENRLNKDSRTIMVSFIRLKCLRGNPQEPLIYLEGGGAPCTGQAKNPHQLSNWIPYLERSDVILFDQRGTTDRSLTWIWTEKYPEEFLVSEHVAGEHWKTMAGKALNAFSERGIDVKGYTVIENAKDIEALREALSIDKYSILGFSFGTTLGLTLINLYEDRIVNAVLAGVDGLTQSFNYPSALDTQFELVSKLAAENSEIKKHIPDLVTLLNLVMNRLDKEPMEVEVINPLSRQPMKVKVGSFGLALILRLDIDDTSDIPIIPNLLYSISQGDASILKEFVQKRIVLAFALPGNGVTQGVSFEASKDRMRKIEKEASVSLFKNVVNFPFYDVKQVWPKSTTGIDLSKPLRSNVRTFFISGDLDCRTPPSQATEIQKGFSNSVHIVVKNAGHEQILSNVEIRKAIPLFLSGHDVRNVKALNGSLQFIPLTVVENNTHPNIKE